MFRNLIVYFLCLLLFSCNDVYYNGKGEQFKVFNQRGDKNIIDAEQLKLHSFNLTSFLAPNTDSIPTIQYISSGDIKSIVQKTGQLFVIFYNPSCPGGGDYVQIGKVAEKNKIPFILIAIFNDPIYMKKWYTKLEMKNKNYYILPSSKKYGRAVLQKKIPFLSELYPSCYKQYRDELLDADYLVIKDNGKMIKLNLEEKIYYPDDAIQWMLKNFK